MRNDWSLQVYAFNDRSTPTHPTPLTYRASAQISVRCWQLSGQPYEYVVGSPILWLEIIHRNYKEHLMRLLSRLSFGDSSFFKLWYSWAAPTSGLQTRTFFFYPAFRTDLDWRQVVVPQ